MSSTRLVGFGFLIAMALLPAMLLNIARNHPDAATSGGAASAEPARADAPKRAWAGSAKARVSGPESGTGLAEMPAGALCGAVVELFLPDAEAGKMAAEIAGACPGALVLSYGDVEAKSASGPGVDPFVPVEAGKRRRAYARAMGDGRAGAGAVVIGCASWIDAPGTPTVPWARKRVAQAGGVAPAALLTLTAAASKPGDGGRLKIGYTVKSAGPKNPLPEDMVFSLMLVGAEGSVLRVLSMRSFQMPRAGTGEIEIDPPASHSEGKDANPARLVGLLQHAKTMTVLGAASIELK